MPKAKVARKSTSIDMTPMVDLAFLLITFFMLTVKFRPQESVEITLASSIASTPVPAKNVLQVNIANDGRVFISMTNQNSRQEWLEKVGGAYNIKFTPEELKQFSILPEVGVNINQMKSLLAKRPEDRAALMKTSLGVPCDSTENQLDKWLFHARILNPDFYLVVKADQKTPYPRVKQVFDTLKKQKANKFNLVTSAEADPRKAAATAN